MTDQDHDGMHIKILVLAFFFKYFPSLLERDFFYDWRTKIVALSRTGHKTIKFYSTRDYENWCEVTPESEKELWTGEVQGSRNFISERCKR